LSFYHYFNWWSSGDYAQVELSVGGGPWQPVRRYTADHGSPTSFALININLATPGVGAAPGIITGAFNDNLLGETDIRVRFVYRSNWGYNWAIDNILVSGA